MHESLGSKLRHERERRKIDLNSIAEATKISVGLLQGLERDDVRRWPSGIFRKSFIKSYAAAVGLDPEVVLKEFIETFPDPMDPLPAAADATARPAPPATRAAIAALASRARLTTFTTTLRTRFKLAVGSVTAAPNSVVSATHSVTAAAGSITSAARSTAGSVTSAARSTASKLRSAAGSSISASSASVRAASHSVSSSVANSITRAGARIANLPKRPKVAVPNGVTAAVSQARSLPGRFSGAIRQLPPVSVRFTIISTGATFTNESFLDGMRRRVAAAACDIAISCALAVLLFIAVGSFWTPFGVSMMCYYVGGIVILGNTPGVCLFAPVRDSGRQPTT
jgi:cytoskeletal protein RodZ